MTVDVLSYWNLEEKWSAASSSVNFQILATDMDWIEPALRAAFCKGHNLALQSELTCLEEGLGLNDLITFTISLDQHFIHNNTHQSNYNFLFDLRYV